MSYEDMSIVYRDKVTRERGEMCIKEQGMIYVNDGRPEIAALGNSVVSGSWMDIEAIMASVSVGPNGTLAVTDDSALLSAVQAVWPTVAAARYPGLVAAP